MAPRDTFEALGKLHLDAEGSLSVETLSGPAARLPLELDDTSAPTPGAIVHVHARDGAAALVGAPLAAPGSARAALYALIADHDLNPFFGPEVTRQTQAWLDAPGLDDPALEDWTDLPFVTIDNADSRDLDQALYIGEGEAEGALVLYYALADASYYVPANTPLFDEALRRGASFYLPGMMVPMLPRALSEGLVSLNEGVDRRALVFRMALNPDASQVTTTLHRARIRSRAKLSYDGVQAFYDAPDTGPIHGADYAPSLLRLQDAGRKLAAQAEARNVVPFERREMYVGFADPDGTHLKAWVVERNDAQRWNEQLSLLCNMEGARFLSQDADAHAHVQPVYKVHPSPGDDQLSQLAGRIADIARARDLPDDPWVWDPAQHTLAAYVERITDATDAQPDLERVRHAIERQIMRAGRASTFSPQRGRHHGVGADAYSRFSSPMREVVGIFTHKEAMEKLHGPGPDHDTAHDEAMREAVIRSGNAARQIQRRLTRAVHRHLLDQRFAQDADLPIDQRPTYTGTIMGVRASRLYVMLDHPVVEVKVYAEHLGDDDAQPTLNRSRTRLTQPNGAAHTIGDTIHIYVDGYDAKLQRWRLLPRTA